MTSPSGCHVRPEPGFRCPPGELGRFKPANKHQAAGTARLILVVDDDELTLEMCQIALRDCGYEVDTAVDGRAAWEALCTRAYDLVITDHRMPGLDGISLIGRIRSVPSQLPVILMSGAFAKVTGEPIEVVDPRFFLSKPMALAEFLKMVRQLLR